MTQDKHILVSDPSKEGQSKPLIGFTDSEKYLRQIVHDLNNFLMILQIHCDKMAENLDERDVNRKQIALMHENIKMISSIVQELTHSRTMHENKTIFSVYDFWTYLKTQHPFLALICGENAILEFNEDIISGGAALSVHRILTEKPEWHGKQIQFFKALLRRVFMQILRNAVEAFLRSSDTSSQTKAENLLNSAAQLHINLQLEVTEQQLLLHIKDNGPGIDKAVEQNIFSEGFSTKSGVARGYGLPAASQLVQLWDGELVHVTDPKQQQSGAHFCISFPFV